jgi:hypothetical protein
MFRGEPGDIDKAHELCEAARVGIKNLKGTACEEYTEAVLVMVEIQYWRGKASAKTWRDIVLKDHRDLLQKKTTEFFLQEFKKPAETNDDPFIGIINSTRNIRLQNPRVEADSDAKIRLHHAIDHGNFLAALFIIGAFDASVLKINSNKGYS